MILLLLYLSYKINNCNVLSNYYSINNIFLNYSQRLKGSSIGCGLRLMKWRSLVWISHFPCVDMSKKKNCSLKLSIKIISLQITKKLSMSFLRSRKRQKMSLQKYPYKFNNKKKYIFFKKINFFLKKKTEIFYFLWFFFLFSFEFVHTWFLCIYLFIFLVLVLVFYFVLLRVFSLLENINNFWWFESTLSSWVVVKSTSCYRDS